MSKTRFIQGKKYNRDLIEAVEALVEGKSSHTLDQQDAQRILTYALAKSPFSATDRRTLQYLLPNFSWKNHTENWFEASLNHHPKDALEKVEQVLEEEFSLFHIKLSIPNTVNEQNCVVNLAQSVRLAIQSFLNNRQDNNVAGVIYRSYDLPANKAESLLQTIQQDLFRHATLSLITPKSDQGDPPQPLLLPAKKESTVSNWVWGLRLHDLPEYYFWAIIDKEGEKEVYHYGMK